MPNCANVHKVTGSQICFDLFPPSKFEQTYGGRSAWHARIAQFFGIKRERAKKLSLDRTPPNGSEIKLYQLAMSGEISLSKIIEQDIQQMEAKYEGYL